MLAAIDTNIVGHITEAKILTRFLQKGYSVSLPYGGKEHYDLIVDTGDKLLRVQCKTAQLLEDGTIIQFSVTRRDRRTGKKALYKNVDYFAAYCPQLDETYLYPASLTNKSRARLRIKVAKDKKSYKTTRWAKDYTL